MVVITVLQFIYSFAFNLIFFIIMFTVLYLLFLHTSNTCAVLSMLLSDFAHKFFTRLHSFWWQTCHLTDLILNDLTLIRSSHPFIYPNVLDQGALSCRWGTSSAWLNLSEACTFSQCFCANSQPENTQCRWTFHYKLPSAVSNPICPLYTVSANPPKIDQWSPEYPQYLKRIPTPTLPHEN